MDLQFSDVVSDRKAGNGNPAYVIGEENHNGHVKDNAPARYRDLQEQQRHEAAIDLGTKYDTNEADANPHKAHDGNRAWKDKREPRLSTKDRNRSKDSLSAVKDGCGRATNYSLGVFVRLLLIAGNVLAAWRTVVETGDQIQCMFVPLCSILMFVEYSVIILKKKGLEWTWWSPCFIVYLGTTLPLVWQMQIQQRVNYIAKLNANQAALDGGAVGVPKPNGTDTTPFTTTTESTVQLQDISLRAVLNISSDTWVIVVNESMVYLIIFARWLLPRGQITRVFLADMLLEFLAMASDIMELLALFDEGKVREDILLNYWILTAWSASFIQFIPVLLHRRRIQRSNVRCFQKACGNQFTEILATFMNIILQDGSFLVLRLYIMIRLNFVTYSLTFFVMKNLLSLLLLFYRLVILFNNSPCCYRKFGNSLRGREVSSNE